MPIDLDVQLEYFDRHAEKAYARCLRAFKERKPEIIAEARRRLEAGFPVYGDEGWHWSHERLHQAELEEVGDMVNYRLMKMRQGWPT